MSISACSESENHEYVTPPIAQRQRAMITTEAITAFDWMFIFIISGNGGFSPPNFGRWGTCPLCSVLSEVEVLDVAFLVRGCLDGLIDSVDGE